ncbi:MFS transporter [Actinomadura rifamycini]|uniref:MFS transporter n=1 Tax=Actinomadura rifamycini TaxID=31962 RepID=UPI000423AEC9|nr:MFS transporter [Actinomadura rifamycini]
MTSTAASRPGAEHNGFTGRYLLLLVALIWPAQLLSVTGLLAGNAQSQIAVHFHTTQIAWFVLVSSLIGAFLTPFVMRAADLFGKRRVMIVLTVLGVIGDLVSALAPNFAVLLLGRGVAGFYAPIAALVFAIARDVFPPRLVGPASGLIGGGVGLVALFGPFLSGWLLDGHGWRSAMWFLAAASAASLVLLLTVVPESPVRQERTPMDWAGGLLLGGGVSAIVYGVGRGSDWGWSSAGFLASVIGGAVAIIAFVVVEGRVAHPLYELSMLSRRRVWSVFLATALLAGTVLSAGTISQLLGLMPKIPAVSDGLGFSATKLAWIGAPASVVIILTAVATGWLARRVDSRYLLASAALFAAVGYGLTAHFHHTVPQLMTVGIVSAIGLGMIVALVPVMVIEVVSPAEQARANGLQNMLQGTLLTVVTQLFFVMMARDGRVVHGTQFYLDAGFTNAFRLAAGFAVAGLLAVALVPKLKRLEETETGEAAR